MVLAVSKTLGCLEGRAAVPSETSFKANDERLLSVPAIGLEGDVLHVGGSGAMVEVQVIVDERQVCR